MLSSDPASGVDSLREDSEDSGVDSEDSKDDSEDSGVDSPLWLSLIEELLGSPLVELSPPLEQDTRLKAITADSATTKIFFIFLNPFCNVK